MAAESNFRKKRVLVVEDDQPILSSLVEVLEEEGYSVVGTRNGQEALEHLKNASELPNLILLDLMMPVKDGIAFREEQELDPRIAQIPVLLMSADSQLETKKYRVGLQHHIKKPIDLDHFIETVKQLCR
jgi:CheY-like chemotaxis protein